MRCILLDHLDAAFVQTPFPQQNVTPATHTKKFGTDAKQDFKGYKVPQLAVNW